MHCFQQQVPQKPRINAIPMETAKLQDVPFLYFVRKIILVNQDVFSVSSVDELNHMWERQIQPNYLNCRSLGYLITL